MTVLHTTKPAMFSACPQSLTFCHSSMIRLPFKYKTQQELLATANRSRVSIHAKNGMQGRGAWSTV